MQKNGFTEMQLQLAVLIALQQGRGKGRNVFIIGETNRAKSFVLKPLASLLFRTYARPDSGSHQLADIAGSELIWLNDYSFEPSWLSWSQLKCFLEGEPLKVAVPKTVGPNYTFDSDAPVLGTGPGPVQHPSSHSETEQMNSRIKYFTFRHWFDPALNPEILACKHCCAVWFLMAQHLLQ